MGYGPIDNLEVELTFGRIRDKAMSPTDTIDALGAGLKWVPLQSETGLSAGLKLDFAREWADHSADAKVTALKGLATWTFESGPRLHVNLGHEWVDFDGAGNEDASTWGVGLDVPLTKPLHLTAETFGAEGARPDRAVGLRYEIAEGLKLSGAVGRGNDRSFANLGVAWEF